MDANPGGVATRMAESSDQNSAAEPTLRQKMIGLMLLALAAGALVYLSVHAAQAALAISLVAGTP
jgi:hypothetical protein